MTSAESRRAARELILELHGANCPQRPLWVELTRLLAEVEARATAVAQPHRAGVVEDQVIQPLDLPATDHTKEHVHARS